MWGSEQIKCELKKKGKKEKNCVLSTKKKQIHMHNKTHT